MPTNDEGLRALLRKATGRLDAEFRDGQREAIDALVSRRKRVLVVQRTGWGKSMVYFLSTRLLRDGGAGPTLIVSPLLALMRNQIEAAARVGIRASTLNSSNTDAWAAIRSSFTGGGLDVLIISPERLANDEFLTTCLLPVAGRIGLLVVDEAHCISDWGHDFRPDYRRIARILRLLPANIPVLATTATANERVVEDVRAQLGADVEVQTGPLMRTSLRLQSVRMPDQVARLAWLAQQIGTLPGSGIIYTLTTRDADRVARWLRSEGYPVESYHGQLDEGLREPRERALLNNQVKALVATSALGMGFDKPDLGFVIHFQAPQSVVHYYQQVGRAGRAIDEAFGVLLTGREDGDIIEFFIRSAFPPVDRIDQLLALLEQDGLTTAEIEQRLNATRGQIEQVLRYLSADEMSPIARQNGRWYRTVHAYQFDHARVAAIDTRRRAEWAEMRRYVDHAGCLQAFLARSLDDPAPAECGRCSCCLRQPVISTAFSDEAKSRAARFLRDTDRVIAPRKRVPRGAVQMFGGGASIPAALQTEEGRALCVWGDTFWAQLVREGKHSGHFADELVDEAARLVRERWSPSPRWVTCVPSLRSPVGVPDFSARLAARLGLPFSPCVQKVRETAPQKSMQNSFHQARNLDNAFTVVPGLVRSGAVLLVRRCRRLGLDFRHGGGPAQELHQRSGVSSGVGLRWPRVSRVP